MARGKQNYQAGPLAKVPDGKFQLPGLTNEVDVYAGSDGLGRPFVMLHQHKVDHYTTVVACNTQSGSLTNRNDADALVAHWDSYMRRMEQEPSLVGFQVVVEAAPAASAMLQRQLAAQRQAAPPNGATPERQPPTMPAAGYATPTVHAVHPNGEAPTVRTFLAYCYDAELVSAKRTRSPAEMGILIAQRLPQLTEGLAATGGGMSRPLTHVELAETVRVAYEPAVATLLEKARSQGLQSGLTWKQVGPKQHEVTWRDYLHDGARSITWVMGEAPRGEVFSSVFSDLLHPHPTIDRKRVSLIYRPHPPVEKNAGELRDGKDLNPEDPHADRKRKRAEQRAAQKAEEEPAPLTRFGMIATATAVDGATQDERGRSTLADLAMENLSAAARIALRRAYGSQDTDFLASLPLGVILPEHVTFKPSHT